MGLSVRRLYTVGHSTRTIEELLTLLAEPGIELLVDVRRFPGSRRHSHFAREALAASLAGAGIGYGHAAALGGHREPRPDSPNSGWRNRSVRGYADHMQGPEFAAALEELLAAATGRPTAVLCAEAVPWRCHRNLLADAATVRGWEVVHLLGPGSSRVHELNPLAVARPEGLTYPTRTAAQTSLLE